jgi:hypothetical protein
VRVYSKRTYSLSCNSDYWKAAISRVASSRGYKEDGFGGYVLLDRGIKRRREERLYFRQIGGFGIVIEVEDEQFVAEASAIAEELEAVGYYVELVKPDPPDADDTHNVKSPPTVDDVDREDVVEYLTQHGWELAVQSLDYLSFDKTDEVGRYRLTLPPVVVPRAKWPERREQLIEQLAIIEGFPRAEVERGLIAVASARIAEEKDREEVSKDRATEAMWGYEHREGREPGKD